MPMRSMILTSSATDFTQQFSHGIGAMHLHGDFADPEIGGDLFVQTAGGDAGSPHRARAG